MALLGALFMACCLRLCAAPEEEFGNDGIDRSDPNFVTASLLIMSPGDELYSCAGHACIRLECPTFNLDYCFSYESESVKEKVLTFFMGKLKMGMFAIPTAEWLKQYESVGRGVTLYRLNLPPAVKQRLWKLLDDKVAEGANLPYDYLKRGCAQSLLVTIRTALSECGSSWTIQKWPDDFKLSRRELVVRMVRRYRWNLFFLQAICGAELDREVPPEDKVLMPLDLLDFLRSARVAGMSVIDAPGVELFAAAPRAGGPVVTPMAVAGLFAALALANLFLRLNWLDWFFLLVQYLAGAFFTYLVFCSSLPATDWNWLIVPFNLLPALLWKWRRKWALWFAAVLVLWECGMVLYPHRLTGSEYLVLVGAYVLMYLRIGWPQRLRQRT